MNCVKELFNYFKGLMYVSRGKNMQFAPIIAGYCALFFCIFFPMFSSGNNGNAVILSALAAILFLSAAAIGMCANNKPNIASLMPISSSKSIVYRYLSTIIFFVFINLVLLLIIAAAVLLNIIIMAIATGGDIFNEFSEEIDFTPNSPIGVYGGLFAFAFFVIMYSAGTITGFIKRRRNRNIFLLIIVCALVVSFILMGLPYHNANGAWVSPLVAVCYENMALPWLSTIFWCLIALGMFGASIYMAIKQYKQSF